MFSFVNREAKTTDRPLDMKGLLEAATVIESLMYGAGHVFKGIDNFYMHGGSFRNSPSDVEFGQLLARNNSLTSPDLPPYCKTTSLISTIQDMWASSDCC